MNLCKLRLPGDLKSDLEAKLGVKNKNDCNMFNKHQKHPCMQKISIFYRKTKKLRKGAPGEEYQTGPLLV